MKFNVVNQTLPSLLRGSLASTLTVPFKSIIITCKYDPRFKIKGAEPCILNAQGTQLE